MNVARWALMAVLLLAGTLLLVRVLELAIPLLLLLVGIAWAVWATATHVGPKGFRVRRRE